MTRSCSCRGAHSENAIQSCHSDRLLQNDVNATFISTAELRIHLRIKAHDVLGGQSVDRQCWIIFAAAHQRTFCGGPTPTN